MQPQVGPNEARRVQSLAPDPRYRQSSPALFRYKCVFRSTKGVTSAPSFPSFQMMLRPGFEDGLRLHNAHEGPVDDYGGSGYRACL